MNHQYEEKLAKEKMFPLIMKMSIPAIAAQLVNLLYNIVDRIYIGHISGTGNDALAGVGITGSIIILISAFSQIVGGGAAPLASISLGKGDREKAEKILGNGLFLLLFFTALTVLTVYIFMEPLLRVIGASDNTIIYAEEYLKIYLLGTLFVQLATGLNSFINVQGRPKIAMISVLIGAVVNIVLDPIFIFLFEMGVSGAALATVVSQFFSCLVVIGFLSSKQASLRIRINFIKPDKKVIISILKLGISPFVMASTESLVGFILNNRLALFGDIYVSSLAVMQSAMQMLSVPLTGFSQGVIPVISYNYGKKNIKRVKEGFRITVTVMFTFMFVTVLFIMLFPNLIANMFTKDILLINTVSEFLPLFICGMSIFGLQRACQNTFVALGQSLVSLFIALLRKVILLIPLAILLPQFMGVRGVFTAEAIADACSAILCTVIFAVLFPKILKKI